MISSPLFSILTQFSLLSTFISFLKLLSGGTDCCQIQRCLLVPIIFNLRPFDTRHALLPVSLLSFGQDFLVLAYCSFPLSLWMFSLNSLFLILPLILLTCWNLLNLDLQLKPLSQVYQCLQQPTRQFSLNMLEAPSIQHDQNQIHYFPTLTFVCSVNTVIYWVSKMATRVKPCAPEFLAPHTGCSLHNSCWVGLPGALMCVSSSQFSLPLLCLRSSSASALP